MQYAMKDSNISKKTDKRAQMELCSFVSNIVFSSVSTMSADVMKEGIHTYLPIYILVLLKNIDHSYPPFLLYA